ncbi:MAG: N-acyl homoserine lactonase family protein [Geminicoccaceae bacterium]|nr:N-acyl homoserine lactonase family protein [Geminicoccaceae bacterium]
MAPAPFELFAVKYAHHHRLARESVVFGDIHDGPMPLDYFVWVAKSAERTFVIDTGFDEATAVKRERPLIRSTGDAVRLLGVDPAHVEDVIITHLHYDHAGDFQTFGRARFHLQDSEMAYATGRHMCHGRLQMPFDVEHVTGMVRAVYGGRVAFHDGSVELCPGFELHRVGGHSNGLQVCRVWTRRGWVVVASDATHFYLNIETGNPFPIVFSVADMLEGHKTCLQLAESRTLRHVVPGHDPLVLERYPAVSSELEGIACRLDEEPAA